MNGFEPLIKNIGLFVWGPVMIILLFTTGLILTIGTKAIQFRKLHLSIKQLFSKDYSGDGDISPFQAVMTSLASTVGTGNIAGVASAIASGGPGAVFWMWVTAAIGGATKYSEALLSIKYRTTNDRGEQSGGPMYYIKIGMNDVYGGNWAWLGWLFAFFGFIASFGIGNMAQSNSVAASIYTSIGLSPVFTGIILFISIGLVIIGGIKSIGKVTEFIVPFMSIVYIIGSIVVIISNSDMIINSFEMIFTNAFSSKAVSGGFLGTVIRYGVSRGVFSNEAGLGSSAIAHAASKNSNAALQGLLGSLESFVDTIIICTMTALVILSSGLISIDESSGRMILEEGLSGAAITTRAFDASLPGGLGSFIVSFGLIFFAFSTILAWYYYGSKCLEYIAGLRVTEIYKWVFILLIFVGAISPIDIVLSISDVFNGLMAVPNLIALIALSPVVYKLTKEFEVSNTYNSHKDDIDLQ
ncbi:MAG: sodium:alanine symporter family protein [Acidaminobacteraceae bacterium]